MDRPIGMPTEEYARLPEDLLAELLRATPNVADEVQALLGPALALRGELRDIALELGIIQRAPAGEAFTVCAVDGGFAVERTVAIDIALSVAVGVEGFAPEGLAWAWDDNQYSLAYHVLGHDLDNERLSRAGMVIQEIDVLADAPHDYRIYDGSHLTPVIQLNAALASESSEVRNLTDQLAQKHGLIGGFKAFTTDPGIVAMPKYDSSRALCGRLQDAVGQAVPGDDKYLASLILQGGEYTVPERVPADPWRQLHIATKAGAGTGAEQLARKLDTALRPLVDRKLFSMYFRPDDTSPAYRLEVKPEVAENEQQIAALLSTISAQLTTPFVHEPYPQYLADVMAKSVGYGLDALQTATHLELANQTPELASVVIHSYRTEGK